MDSIMLASLASQKRVSSVQTISVLTTGSKLLNTNANRVAIIFTGSNVGRVTFGNDPNPTLDNGPTLVINSGPLELLYEIHGEIVKKPWFGISAAGPSAIGIIEVLSG